MERAAALLRAPSRPLRTALRHPAPARWQPGACQRCLVCAALVSAALRGLCSARLRDPASGFVPPGRELPELRVGEAAAGLPAGVARRSALAGTMLVAPLPAQAILGVGNGPALKPYTIAGAYNVSFPPDFEVLQESPQGLILQGDKIQPLEQMTAAAKVVPYVDLATGLGANITEVGERLAAKRKSGAAELMEATVDPTGEGLDAYQFEFSGDNIHELWLVAVVKKGSESVFCNVAVRTPSLLWDTRKDVFKSILVSFKPLEPQPARRVAAPA